MKRVVLIFLLLFPVLSLAGPWCQVMDSSEYCNFELAEECYKAASVLGGYCRPNSIDVGTGGVARWCVVTATQRTCIYRFRARCMALARQLEGAGCVENIELALQSKALRQGVIGGEGKCDNVACELSVLGIDQGPPPSE
jgi:hypothetical protein